MPASPTRPDPCTLAAWGIAAVLLLLAFPLHMVSVLLSGMLVHEVVQSLAAALHIQRFSHKRTKGVVVGALATAVVVGLGLCVWGAVRYVQDNSVSVALLVGKMLEILDNIRASLPSWAGQAIPQSFDDLYTLLTSQLKQHALALQSAGKGLGLAILHVIFGMVLGAIVALSSATAEANPRPLAAALLRQAQRFSEAFRSIVFAQIRISLINTVLTGMYLGLLLPAFGVRLPFIPVILVITFTVGLIPVLGNTISNTVIIIVGLSESLWVAAGSLGYLMFIHQLEYILNAKIVGTQIRARVWEILLAMLLMEAAFGMPGLIAAPIYYAYLKRELADAGLV